MLVAEVLIDIQTKSLNHTYSYLLPDDVKEGIVGCAVLVQFGRRSEVGFVLAVKESEQTDKLKTIDRILTTSFFTSSNVELAYFMSRRYLCPLVSCIRLFIPQGVVPRFKNVAGVGRVLEDSQVGSVTERWISSGPEIDKFTPRKNAYKQIQIIELVREADIKVSELSLLLGDVSQAIKSLEEKGVLCIETRRRFRQDEAMQTHIFKDKKSSIELTSGQRNALENIEQAISEADGKVVLIDGVTGSGKTEVYIRSISKVLQSGRGCIVLVPEIALTPQMVARFRSRFGDSVSLLHSKMSAGERYDQFEMIRSGQSRVVIGPRSALFAPMADIGLVIIDEEHETTYKQESAPRYVSRDIAIWMMRQNGGTVILGSATPSIEALYAANTSPDWTLCEMHERANGNKMPDIEIVDMTSEFRDGEKSIFSRRLKRSIIDELKCGHKVVLLLNQRGFARFLLCRDCGFVPECINCSTSLTVHEENNLLVCHHCGYVVQAPPRCPSCDSPYLKKFGVGTERAEAELRAFLDSELNLDLGEAGNDSSSIPIIRMDADTTSQKGAHKRLLEEFASAEGAVLLGTQMIAKGLDFEDVTLVGVINADTQLHLPDFRASERTFDLIEQVAGRAGRAELSGRVLVQTYEADSLAIQAAAKYDRELFLRSELPKRRALKYPPFVRMANFLIWGAKEADVATHSKRIYEVLKDSLCEGGCKDFEISAPTSCAFEKIRNNFRWHIVIKCSNDKDISEALLPIFKKIKPIPGVNTAIDIDPIDML